LKTRIFVYIIFLSVFCASVFAVEVSNSIGTLGNDSLGFKYQKGVDVLSIKIKAESGGFERDITDLVKKSVWSEKDRLKYGFSFTVPNSAQGVFVSNNANNLTVYYEVRTNSNFVLDDKKFVYSRNIGFGQIESKIVRRYLDFSDLSTKRGMKVSRSYDSSSGVYTLRAYCLDNTDVSIGDFIDCDPTISETSASDWANGTFYRTFNHSRGSLTVDPLFIEYGFLNETYLNNSLSDGFYVSYADDAPNVSKSNTTMIQGGCAWTTQPCARFNDTSSVVLKNSSIGESFYDGGYDAFGKTIEGVNFTIGIILNATETQNNRMLIGKGTAGGANGWVMQTAGTGGSVDCFSQGTSLIARATNSLVMNTTTFFVCVWNDSGVWIFQDGTLKDNKTLAPTYVGNALFPTIGHNAASGASNTLNMSVSYYFFAKRALSFTDVLALNSTWKTAPESLMKGYYSSGNYTSRILNWTRESNITRVDISAVFSKASLNLSFDSNTSSSGMVNTVCSLDIPNRFNNCSLGVSSLFFKYVINGSSLTNATSFELLDINVTSNIIPGKVGIVLNSSGGSNSTHQDLRLLFRIDDPDNSSVNYSIEWFRNNVSNYSYLLLAADNSSLLKFNLSRQNLTIGDSWHVRVNVTDGVTPSNNTNSSTVTIRRNFMETVITTPANSSTFKTGTDACNKNISFSFSVLNDSVLSSCFVELLLFNGSGFQTSVSNRSMNCLLNDSFVASLGCASGNKWYTLGVYANDTYGVANSTHHVVYLTNEIEAGGGGAGGGGGGFFGVAPVNVSNVSEEIILGEEDGVEKKCRSTLDCLSSLLHSFGEKIKGSKTIDWFKRLKPDADVVVLPTVFIAFGLLIASFTILYFLLSPFKKFIGDRWRVFTVFLTSLLLTLLWVLVS